MISADDVAAVPSWIIEPTDQNNGLCICSMRLANDFQKLKELNIGAIVTVAYEARDILLPPEIRRLHIDMVDAEQEKIYSFFNLTFHFIDDNLQKTNVLVHCVAGVSRSPAIVIAYLIRKNNCTMK
jgi:protein-tyrosine phosphatase